MDAYRVSDCIFKLRRIFETEWKNGVTFRPDEIEVISAFLMMVGQTANLQAHELSRYRASAVARAERDAEDQLLAEMARPGTNVLPLHGYFEQPSFSHPGGVA